VNILGGSDLGEKAMTAFEMGKWLSDFEAGSTSDQMWAIVTRRIQKKMDAIVLRETLDR